MIYIYAILYVYDIYIYTISYSMYMIFIYIYDVYVVYVTACLYPYGKQWLIRFP